MAYVMEENIRNEDYFHDKIRFGNIVLKSNFCKDDINLRIIRCIIKPVRNVVNWQNFGLSFH